MEEKELRMDEKVEVRSIAPWNVAFTNSDGRSGTRFSPNGSTRIRREEIVQQVQANNKLFTGVDGMGSHATLYIEDETLRKYLEFDSSDGKYTQNVLTPDRARKIFALKTMNAFKKNIEEAVITRAEKRYLMKLIKDLKFNEYDKITFCQEYCKFTLR